MPYSQSDKPEKPDIDYFLILAHLHDAELSTKRLCANACMCSPRKILDSKEYRPRFKMLAAKKVVRAVAQLAPMRKTKEKNE